MSLSNTGVCQVRVCQVSDSLTADFNDLRSDITRRESFLTCLPTHETTTKYRTWSGDFDSSLTAILMVYCGRKRYSISWRWDC